MTSPYRHLERPHRLVWPRTLDFQSSNGGSNPPGVMRPAAGTACCGSLFLCAVGWGVARSRAGVECCGRRVGLSVSPVAWLPVNHERAPFARDSRECAHHRRRASAARGEVRIAGDGWTLAAVAPEGRGGPGVEEPAGCRGLRGSCLSPDLIEPTASVAELRMPIRPATASSLSDGPRRCGRGPSRRTIARFESGRCRCGGWWNMCVGGAAGRRSCRWLPFGGRWLP